MHLVLAHSTLHWLEPALFAVPALAVVAAIVRERRRCGAIPNRENP